MATGFCGPMLLLAARNASVGAPLLETSGNGAITFVSSNNIAYPAIGGFSLDIDRIGAIMCATHGRLVSAVLTTIGTHTPGSLASLLWHKFDHIWSWYEMPNNANFYYLRLHSAVLSAMPVTFFLVAPLGLVGLVLAFRERRRLWPLYSLVVWIVGILTIFLVLGRLRNVLIAAMIPFAALTVVRFCRSAHPWRIAVAVLAVALWTGRPLPPNEPLISVTDWFTPYWITYEAQVKTRLAVSDLAGAAQALHESFQYEPDFSLMDRANGQLVEPGDRAAARAFARMHQECAGLFDRAGEPVQADTERQRVVGLTRLAGGR